MNTSYLYRLNKNNTRDYGKYYSMCYAIVNTKRENIRKHKMKVICNFYCKDFTMLNKKQLYSPYTLLLKMDKRFATMLLHKNTLNYPTFTKSYKAKIHNIWNCWLNENIDIIHINKYFKKYFPNYKLILHKSYLFKCYRKKYRKLCFVSFVYKYIPIKYINIEEFHCANMLDFVIYDEIYYKGYDRENIFDIFRLPYRIILRVFDFKIFNIWLLSGKITLEPNIKALLMHKNFKKVIPNNIRNLYLKSHKIKLSAVVRYNLHYNEYLLKKYNATGNAIDIKNIFVNNVYMDIYISPEQIKNYVLKD